MRRLQELVALSDTDCRILEFAVLIHSERILDDLADELGPLSTIKMFHVLSVLLGIPESDIRTALSSQGVLARAGLVSVERNGNAKLRGKLDLLSTKFADIIVSSEADPVTLLRDTVTLASAPQLGLGDYDHIGESLAVLRPHLKNSIALGCKGVNVYLHGESGTGKSQLAKVPARELDCELFEVASEDGDGDPVKGETRLRAFRAAQSFFSRRRAIILFDEVEDVFNDGEGFFGGKSTAQKRKAWMNRTLEENAVPTLWLSNAIEGIDPAFIRRFDMVFELKVPPIPRSSTQARIWLPWGRGWSKPSPAESACTVLRGRARALTRGGWRSRSASRSSRGARRTCFRCTWAATRRTSPRHSRKPERKGRCC
jgi:hypothetical protein